MILQPGEIVLVRIEFREASGGKIRPALVLLDSGDNDFVAAPVTSRSRGSEFDVAIRRWSEAGLNIASTVRLHELTVLAKHEIVRCIGDLDVTDRSTVAAVLRRAFSWGG